MKKNFILAVILGLGLMLNAAPSNAEQTNAPQGPKPPCTECPPPQHNGHKCPPPHMKDGKMKQAQQEFENRLKLSEEQKTKAKEIRMQGREELRPIMEELRAKKEQIRTIKASNASDKSKEKQISKKRTEIKQLREKADAIREKNMSQFEAILSSEQKAEFEKYKKEMKAKHEQFRKQMEQKRGQYQPQPVAPVQK